MNINKVLFRLSIVVLVLLVLAIGVSVQAQSVEPDRMVWLPVVVR